LSAWFDPFVVIIVLGVDDETVVRGFDLAAIDLLAEAGELFGASLQAKLLIRERRSQRLNSGFVRPYRDRRRVSLESCLLTFGAGEVDDRS
jgi:hypothetical protein